MTEEQLRAVNTRGKNILVNSAAGSGKTKVLTERIISMISDKENPVDIDALLIVTFTRAAAKEMKERINKAITEKILQNPDDAHLKNQLIKLGNADITTIDAFCLNCVKSNFHLLGLDPSFSIISGKESEMIFNEVMDEVIENFYIKSDDEFLKLVEMYSYNNTDVKLVEMITKIYKYVSASPDIDKELERLRGLYDNTEIYTNELCKIVMENISAAEYIYNRILELVDLCDVDKTKDKMFPLMENEADLFDKVLNALRENNWDMAVQGFNNINFERCAWKGIDDEARGLRDNAKKIYDTVKAYFRFGSIDDIKTLIKSKYKPVIDKLIDITGEFSKAYNEKKRSINKLEFSDVERMCLKLLHNEDGTKSDVCLSMTDKYYEIMIDEYQDSNQLQEDIFSAVSNGRNMFMVGDMKQSIYSFRNSDPSLFKSKCAFPTDYDTDKPDVKIVLSKNFRSCGACIDAINEIFENIMSEECGDIEYDDEQRLRLGNMRYDIEKNPESLLRAELDIIISDENAKGGNDDSDGNDEEVKEIPEKIRIEARYVAKRIKELKRAGYKVMDKNTGEYRELKNSDVAVLLRAGSSGNAAGIFAEELNENGIAAYAQSSGYFNRPEVKTMLSAMKVINNPLCDIPLIALIYSPIYGISANTIAKIKVFNKSGSIYGNILGILNEEDKKGFEDVEIYKMTKLIEDIKRWRGYAKYMPCDKLIWTVYEETGFYNMCASFSGGEEKCANLVLLFENARNFENSGFKGLFGFIKLIEHFIKNNVEMNTANLINENHNVVRVMNIHKSKGLEFPVVILANAAKKFNKTDLGNDILIDRDFGIGLKYSDIDEYYKYDTIVKELIRGKKESEIRSEEMRLLYVALTRAREKIIVISSAKKDYIKKIKEPSSADSYFEWLISVIGGESMYWDVNEISSIGKPDNDEETEKEAITEKFEGIDISGIFNYEYKYKAFTEIEAKISVTELKRKYTEQETSLFDNDIIVKKPAFMRDKEITPVQRGVVVHLVMQNINIIPDINKEYIREEIQRIVKEGLLTDEEAEYVNIDKINNFFKSDIGKRILKAENVYREAEFEIPIKAGEIDKSIKTDENIILQGIIDCYFEEDGEIVLVDYKTDYYTDTNQIKDKYAVQIYYYKKVLEKLTKKVVKNSYLYLFFNNDVVECK